MKLNQYINYLLLGYAFCLPISESGTVFFEILMIILWLFEGDIRYNFKELQQNRLIILIFSLVGFSLISVCWSPNKLEALLFIKKYYHFLIIPIIYTSLRVEYIKHVFSAFLIGMLVSIIMSYGIFFELWSYKNVLQSDPSPFIDRVNYSIYLAFTSIILLNRIFFEEELKWKFIYSLYFFIAALNLFINSGRTGQVAFVVSIIVFVHLNIKHKTKALITALILGLSITCAGYLISPNLKNRMNQTRHDIENMLVNKKYDDALSIRISLWIMGVNVFKDNFISGTGIGAEMNGLVDYAKKYNFTGYVTIVNDKKHGYIDYHNAFIQYGVGLGIIGLLLFISIFYAQFRLKFKSAMYHNLNIVFLYIYILLSFGGFSFHIMSSMVLYALFVGVFSTIPKLEY